MVVIYNIEISKYNSCNFQSIPPKRYNQTTWQTNRILFVNLAIFVLLCEVEFEETSIKTVLQCHSCLQTNLVETSITGHARSHNCHYIYKVYNCSYLNIFDIVLVELTRTRTYTQRKLSQKGRGDTGICSINP